MADVQKFSVVEELQKADERLKDSPSLLGMTMLSYPMYINAMRGTMFTAHLKQYLDLIEPQFPLLFTNTENLVGKYSSGYKTAVNTLLAGKERKIKSKIEPDKGYEEVYYEKDENDVDISPDTTFKVYKKISKFDDIIDNPQIYYLFLYNEETDTYSLVHRKPCESLTENFGYDYNNNFIDSLDEGDDIEGGDVLYKSTSYDEDMNFAYGRNVNVAYTLDPFTSEDAAVASRSMCKEFTSIETDDYLIGLNQNDFLVNLYGNKEKYKPFPDIGEHTSDILCAVRRQFNNQLLFDFKEDSLNEIHEGDLIFYAEKNIEIIDIEIFDNTEEYNDSPFTHQLNKYLKSQNKFYNSIIKTCRKIMESGSKYTRDIDYLYKRALEFTDKDKKWVDADGKEFGSMEVKIYVKRYAPLAKGCKVTGRYGNKSVIAQIREDDEMPYTKDGRRVDLLLNLLAIINRTTAQALTELFINGCSFQIRKHMASLTSLEEKETELFDYIGLINEKQCKLMHKAYKKLKKKEKEEYIENVIRYGIYVNEKPIGEDKPIFYSCIDVLKRFPYLKEDDLYINKYGREIKILGKQWVGEMYIIKLKQSDRRGFSARSTGALDTRSLPTRSTKSKAHLEQKSSSCIRFKLLNHYIVIYSCKLCELLGTLVIDNQQ